MLRSIAPYISLGCVIAIIILFVFLTPFTLGEYKEYIEGTRVMARPVGHLERSFLMIAVLMVPSALCHGLGLRPENPWGKFFTHPLLIWPLMIIGISGTLYLS